MRQHRYDVTTARVIACAAAVVATVVVAPVARADDDADYVEQLEIYGIHGDAN